MNFFNFTRSLSLELKKYDPDKVSLSVYAFDQTLPWMPWYMYDKHTGEMITGRIDEFVVRLDDKSMPPRITILSSDSTKLWCRKMSELFLCSDSEYLNYEPHHVRQSKVKKCRYIIPSDLFEKILKDISNQKLKKELDNLDCLEEN